MKRSIAIVAVLTALSLLASFGVSAAATGDATVHVVHGVPGVKVDVCVDGTEVRSGFAYTGRFTTALPAGEYRVAIRLASSGTCDGDVVRVRTVEIAAGKNYTLIAGLTAAGAPKIFAFVNRMGALADGSARVQVRHTAAAPAVDVRVNGAVAIPSLLPGAEANVVLPTDGYRVAVTPAGTQTVVIGPRTFELADGTAYQIFAVGNADAGYRFLVLAQPV